MANISSYELIDHGIENSQYFQGCGTSYTPFEHVVTGIGDNPAEAIDDCLEQIAANGINVSDFESRMLADEKLTEWPTTPVVFYDSDIDDDWDMYYHVSIRYNVA